MCTRAAAAEVQLLGHGEEVAQVAKLDHRGDRNRATDSDTETV
jgi:hypothetical protein